MKPTVAFTAVGVVCLLVAGSALEIHPGGHGPAPSQQAGPPPAPPPQRPQVPAFRSRVTLVPLDRAAFLAGRRLAALDVKVYCGDVREKPIGELSNALNLNLTEETYRRYLREGVPYAARVPVTGRVRWVKVVVYDKAADLVGSMVAGLW
jgi:hypothetical protein